MDRETINKMKKAQKKAQEIQEKRELSKFPENKEFWEEKEKGLKEFITQLKGQLADAEYVLNTYKIKIGQFQ